MVTIDNIETFKLFQVRFLSLIGMFENFMGIKCYEYRLSINWRCIRPNQLKNIAYPTSWTSLINRYKFPEIWNFRLYILRTYKSVVPGS